MELATARLSLRAPDIRHAADIMVLANDRRVADRLARMPHPYSHADALWWIAYCQTNLRSPAGATFAVFAGPDRDTFVGACGIGLSGRPREGVLGYWIGAPYWGKGYVFEAARAVLDHGFGTLKLPAVRSAAQVANPYSRSVLERLGFRHLGVKVIDTLVRGPDPVDDFLLKREQWR